MVYYTGKYRLGTLLTAIIDISVVSRSALTMKMSFFYCILPASSLHHSVDDGRQTADLTGLTAQVVLHGSFFAHDEVCFHLAFTLHRNRPSEFRLVTPVHQDLRKTTKKKHSYFANINNTLQS